jgi:hypothetical protein
MLVWNGGNLVSPWPFQYFRAYEFEGETSREALIPTDRTEPP